MNIICKINTKQISNLVMIECKELYNNKTWIHGNSNKNINITIFLITIQGEQLKYSLDAINNLNPDYPVLINVIMNISPTNKAYNKMRKRCTTPYFVQLDEDMELKPDAIEIFQKTIKKSDSSKIFLNTFKLQDDVLGVGNPPIIDCLKLYNNEIMKKYPTYDNGNEAVSSVDYLWHKPILNDGYQHKDTKIIIGYHGKHRTDFDLFLRYCKITNSLLDPKIKTNNGHLCKLLKPLHNDNISIGKLINTVSIDFTKFNDVNQDKFKNIIQILNSHINKNYLAMYNIKNRQNITLDTNKVKLAEVNKDKVVCVVAILCVITGNYAYSFDKYPKDIFNYFMDTYYK